MLACVVCFILQEAGNVFQGGFFHFPFPLGMCENPDSLHPCQHLVLPLIFFFNLFRATPVAYEGSQARGQMGAIAALLHHSHSNLGSELHLRSRPQLTAMPDPQPTEQGQRWNLHPHGY